MLGRSDSDTQHKHGFVIKKWGRKMKAFFQGMASNLGVAGELMGFLWVRKLWWLMPMMFLIIVFGLLMIFASASGVAPFIYTLF
jgi:hypothetical protein